MKIKLLLTFNGNAQDALIYYQDVFDGTIDIIHKYGDYEDFKDNHSYKDKIIHSDLLFNDCVLSLSDAMPNTHATFGDLGYTVTLFCDSTEHLKNIYDKLCIGGQIKCELCTLCYAKQYAEVIDRFGVLWALIIK